MAIVAGTAARWAVWPNAPSPYMRRALKACLGRPQSQELAKELGPEAIGYRRVKCVGQGKQPGTFQPEWLEAGYQRDMGALTLRVIFMSYDVWIMLNVTILILLLPCPVSTHTPTAWSPRTRSQN